MSRMILLAIIAQTGGDRYYATEQYATRNGDTPANTLFEGRLVDAIYERSASFPAWNRDGGSAAINYLELINTDGGLDSWLAEDWKAIRVTLKLVEARAAYSTATQVGVIVIDRVVAPSVTRIRLVCRSVYERLEQVITTTYPDTITNEGLRGKPKPITIGRCRWVPGLNPTINDSGGSQRGIWDICDGPFESITELRANGALMTEVQYGLVNNTSPEEYFVIQDESPDEWTAPSGYGWFLRAQIRKQAAEVRGQLRRIAQLVSNETFPSASGSDPTGWSVTEGGAGLVTWNSAGNVSIDGDGSADTYIAQTLSLTSGVLYQIEVEIYTLTGVLSISYGSTVLRGIDGTNPIRATVSFTAGAGTEIRVGYVSGASGSAVITAVRCYSCARIDTLAEIVRFAAVTRGQLSTGDVDSTALAAIDTATGYAIGWHSGGADVRGIDLVTLAARSFGCAIYQDNSGALVPVQIAAPAGTAAFELDELSITEIGYEADDAPGLATRMYYGHNYNQHSVDETVGLSAATYPELRAELQQDVRVVTTTETLDAIYAEAQEREPMDSLLSEEADAQAEIDRLCALYTQPRAFYTLSAFVDSATAHTIEPGATVQVTHSRYGLSAGVNLLVVAARSDFLGNSVNLVLWG